MANPDPEITPPDAKAARPDAIIATGRSDYPNQVNNVLGFPFIFRGALDVRATTINDEMKIAAAEALAELARQQVPEEVAAAYGGKAHSFGPDYIIPAPFDPRLMEVVPAAVAQAAMDSGVAQQADRRHGRLSHRARARGSTRPPRCSPSPTRRRAPIPRRVLFAEGEEDVVLRAAIAFRDGGYGIPVLVGRDDVHDRLRALGVEDPEAFEVYNSRNYPRVPEMVDYLYERLQRRGYLHREVERMVNQDRNIFASLLLALGEADAMITGVTRTYAQSMRQIRRVLDPEGGRDAVRHPRAGRPDPHRVHRRHDGHRAADRRAARRDRRSRPRRSPGGWATSRASPSCPIRISAIPRAASSSGSATR